MRGLLGKILGDPGEREVARISSITEEINALEPQMGELSDEGLRMLAGQWRGQVAETVEGLEGGELKRGLREALDELLAEVFAGVREASRRVIGLRHFDVQMIGGAVLHRGKIAEMKTGEGKTLVATLPIALNALSGRGVHLVTVNDYLSRRDAGWMGPVYHALGFSVAAIGHEFSGLYDPGYEDPKPHHDSRLNHFRPISRREAYAADITYGTNNEFGFDYLRDNMVLREEDLVQRPLYYAIVDEVDFILIDEARTPLIISGMVEGAVDRYQRFARVVPRLNSATDYTVDEKIKNALLTDEGVAHTERLLGVDDLSDPEHGDLMHHLQQALRAHAVYKRDVDYVVKDGQVIIVDEFTGRLMFGRRYSDGLHQAIEAKEGVRVERESQTLATITFQNYFRMYEKLAGMTGTAKTEEEELSKIYNLQVLPIPTNRPMIRRDHSDLIYKTERAKWKAVVEEIAEGHAQGRPTLVGTRSIEKNEHLSGLLRRRGVPHEVLNAKQHEREAEIIAQAGRLGAVTIATNMAGRGVDIILGGNPPDPQEAERVRGLGGLHVIGTERHEARRIDNQLRGRAGRQGDPGSSRFYVGLDDELMRIFAGERIAGLMDRLGLDEDIPIEHSLVTRQIESAQKKVEQYHFDVRKHVLEYDDVMNVQRNVIYAERRKVLDGATVHDNVLDIVERLVSSHVDTVCVKEVHPSDWDLEGLLEQLGRTIPTLAEIDPDTLTGLPADQVRERLTTLALGAYEEREAEIGSTTMREIERLVLLQNIDRKWIDNLYNMDALREGIGLRAYAQASPLVEYQREGYELFRATLAAIQEDTVRMLFRVEVVPEERAVARPPQRPPRQAATSPAGAAAGKSSRSATAERPRGDGGALAAPGRRSQRRAVGAGVPGAGSRLAGLGSAGTPPAIHRRPAAAAGLRRWLRRRPCRIRGADALDRGVRLPCLAPVERRHGPVHGGVCGVGAAVGARPQDRRALVGSPLLGGCRGASLPWPARLSLGTARADPAPLAVGAARGLGRWGPRALRTHRRSQRTACHDDRHPDRRPPDQAQGWDPGLPPVRRAGTRGRRRRARGRPSGRRSHVVSARRGPLGHGGCDPAQRLAPAGLGRPGGLLAAGGVAGADRQRGGSRRRADSLPRVGRARRSRIR